jgi:predicted Fe-Mo cluster-binding NifX family protein
MKIVCIPTAEGRGLFSPVHPDLANAPYLLLVDAETLAFRSIPNSAERRRERGCDPCEALEDTPVDVVLVQRADPRTVERMERRHVSVYGGARGSVADALAALIAGRLERLQAPALAGSGD